jgi:hypothetical protein
VTDYKIAIVGTTMLLTKQAVDYFVENYLKESAFNKTVLTMNKKITNERMEMVTLVDEGEVKSVVVYADGLDTEKGSAVGAANLANDYDYPYVAAQNVCTLLKNVAGVESVTAQAASAAVPEKTVEVVMGNVARDTMQAYLAGVAANQYGVVVRDGKLLVVAWNDTALASAASLLDGCVRAAASTDEDGKVTVKVLFLQLLVGGFGDGLIGGTRLSAVAALGGIVGGLTAGYGGKKQARAQKQSQEEGCDALGVFHGRPRILKFWGMRKETDQNRAPQAATTP